MIDIGPCTVVVRHTHDDIDHLTFGCDGCVSRIAAERWRGAPVQRVDFEAVVPRHVATLNGDTIRWSFSMEARVPVDVTGDELEDVDRFDIGAALCKTMPSGLSVAQVRVTAIATAVVKVVKVTPIDTTPAELPGQESLL